MTEDEAFSRLRGLLVEISTESVALGSFAQPLADVRKAWQKGPQPQGAYAMLTPLGSRDSGDGYTLCYEPFTFEGEDRVVEVRTQGITYGWRVDLYASRAHDWARAFRAALTSARGNLQLLPATVAELGEIKGSAERDQEQWEGRANFMVTLSVPRQQRTLIEVVEGGHIGLSGLGSSPTPIDQSLDYAKE